MNQDRSNLYVFISFAWPQVEMAARVEECLKAAGLRVFRASGIPKGANWDVAIEQALQETNRMVLLLSKDSMPYRKEVHREWFFYDRESKPIYPLLVEKCKLHSRMYSYNYIDVTALGWQKALESLLTEVGRPFTPPGEADPVVEADSPGSVVLTPAQITELVQHQPRDLAEYRLARIAEWSQERYRIDRRFVNLTLLIDQGEDAQGARWVAPESRHFTDLRDVVKERRDDPVLVLLGAPGSGKSTVLRRFQLDTAADTLRGGEDPVTFFVSLNSYKIDSGEPGEWLNAEWMRRYPDLPKLDELRAEGKVVLLLDALNEMPHRTPADYHQRVGQWRDFIQSIVPQGNRALFSCRSLDYSTPLSSKELRVPHVVVQPMDDGQIQAFLKAYLPDRAEHTWRELEGTPQLGLYRTPYFLKLLCEQVEVHGAVPKGRASLFAGFVRQALEREVTGGNALFEPDSLLTEKDRQRN